MPDFYTKSLRNKLLTLFIGIGIIPLLTLLTYTIFLSETKILNKIIVEQSQRAEVVISLIQSHLYSIDKEVKFLSSLDIMDDILADDLDKRISRLLVKKMNDLNLRASLYVISHDGVIIASSDKKLLLKKITLKKLKSYEQSHIKKEILYISSNIFASFDGNKVIGTLVMEYNLNNLDLYLTHTNSIHSYIMNPKTNLTIGEMIDKKIETQIDFTQSIYTSIDSKNVIVSKKLSNFLDGWNIVYAVDKNVALEFLYDYIKFMLYMSVIILIIIIYIAIKNAKEIIKPIEELKNTTDSITQTHNYATQLKISAEDEIGALTHSFNTMLVTTSEALKNLEKENTLRLKRFTQLIEVFNTIIQTKDEEECINTSINEIKKLTKQEKLIFHKNSNFLSSENTVQIYITDFENDMKKHFGSIELGIDSFEDSNERNFYTSIASMITLQLDRIRLIERTMSASRAKSAFISNMSHELRTPLNAIIGFAQFMITYEELNEDQMDTVSNIESSAQYLLGMINEILDISKIEAGKMEANIEEVDIESIIKNSYTMLKPLANDKNIELILSKEEYTSQLYKTDSKMLQQILINIISNAIKFTQKGNVNITYTSSASDIQITVQDTGIGISSDAMKFLFNDFTQVENVMQKKHKGTGLGLSLSKKMAEILGGSVTLQSEGLGCGSTAVFQLHF
ncbi:HAMP domain-containing protein [Sulfurimonas sp. SAG-AH-194-I05]|nr:ATP-binding protein [Sulfurimonas sp. SAG-AH-194-I05]MDF1875956.1 HAMP domain-containing protein [Sulfurimonas sp. SAG-AH-194-I05]